MGKRQLTIFTQKDLCVSQSCDSRLTELAARAEDLQRTSESTSTQEALPADIILTVSAISEDLGRCFTSF